MAPGNFIAGVCIALCTTAMSAIGLTLQKIAHTDVARRRELAVLAGKDPSKIKTTRQCKWLSGLVFMAVSSLVSLAVFALVGQSVASSFAAMTIVWNLLLAHYFLFEAVEVFDILIAAAMVSGCILAVVFGSRGAQVNHALTLDDILAIWRRPASVAGMVTAVVVVIASTTFFLTVDAAVRSGKLKRQAARFRISLFSRALNAGIMSGFTGMLSKAVVTMFAAATANVARWEPWVCLILLPCSLGCQVFFLNNALKNFSNKEAVPLYQSLLVLCGVIFGLVIFDEASGMTAGDLVGFICGIALVITGILSLLVRKNHSAAIVSVSILRLVDALLVSGVKQQPTLCSGHAIRRIASAPGCIIRMHANSNGTEDELQLASASNVTVAMIGLPGPPFKSVMATMNGDSQCITPRALLGPPLQLAAEDSVSYQQVGSNYLKAASLPASCAIDAVLPVRARRRSCPSSGLCIATARALANISMLVEPRQEEAALDEVASTNAALERHGVIDDEDRQTHTAELANLAFPLGAPDMIGSPGGPFDLSSCGSDDACSLAEQMVRAESLRVLLSPPGMSAVARRPMVSASAVAGGSRSSLASALPLQTSQSWAQARRQQFPGLPVLAVFVHASRGCEEGGCAAAPVAVAPSPGATGTGSSCRVNVFPEEARAAGIHSQVEETRRYIASPARPASSRRKAMLVLPLGVVQRMRVDAALVAAVLRARVFGHRAGSTVAARQRWPQLRFPRLQGGDTHWSSHCGSLACVPLSLPVAAESEAAAIPRPLQTDDNEIASALSSVPTLQPGPACLLSSASEVGA